MNESVNSFLIHFNPDKIEHNTLQAHANFLRRSEVYEVFQQLSDQDLSREEIYRIKKRLSDFWKDCAALLTINATSLEILSIFIVYYHKQHEFLINFHLDFSAQTFMPAWCNRWLAMNWDANLRDSTACMYHYGRMIKHYSTLFYDKNNLCQLLSPKITSLLLCINQHGRNYNDFTLGNVEQYISNLYTSIGQLAVLGCAIQLRYPIIKEALLLLIYYTNYSNKSSQALSSFILALGYMARYNCGIILDSAAIRASLDIFFNTVRYTDKSALEIANIVLGVGYLAKNGNVFVLYDKINLALYTLCLHLSKRKNHANYQAHTERAISVFYAGMRYIVERGSVFQLVSEFVDNSIMIVLRLKKVNLRLLIGCLLTLALFIKKNQRLELHYLPQVMEKILPRIAELGIIDIQHLHLFLTTVSRYMPLSQIGINARFIEELDSQVNNFTALGQPLNIARLEALAVVTFQSGAKREIKFDINSRVFIPQSAVITLQKSFLQQVESCSSVVANNTGESCLQKDVVESVGNAANETTVAPPLLITENNDDRNSGADLQVLDSHGSDKYESGSQTSSERLNGNVKVGNDSPPSEEGFGDDSNGDAHYSDEKSDDDLKIDGINSQKELYDKDYTQNNNVMDQNTADNGNVKSSSVNDENNTRDINDAGASPVVRNRQKNKMKKDKLKKAQLLAMSDMSMPLVNTQQVTVDSIDSQQSSDKPVSFFKSQHNSQDDNDQTQGQYKYHIQMNATKKLSNSIFGNYGGLLWNLFTSCCPVMSETVEEAAEQVNCRSNKVKLI